ncbi:MAG: response regulator transcription factor [Chloroflexi bacterium]|nr:response regulator transcription factor [Chloroflexota bacterium]
MRPIRLAFVSTNALTRSGIHQIMARSEPSIDVVCTVSDFPAAHLYLDDHPVDVILIDESLPRHTNLLLEVQSLCFEHFGVAVILILQRPTVSQVLKLLQVHGVRGILQRNDDLESYLAQAIILGKQRGTYLSPGISEFIDSQRRLPSGVSQRDIDVLRLLADGLDAKEIASHIGVRSHTVYRILQSLRALFNVQSNTHLIATAHQSGLLDAQGIEQGCR